MSSSTITWESPAGGMRIRGKKPDRAVAVAVDLIERFTAGSDFDRVELQIMARASKALAAWCLGEGADSRISSERAKEGVLAPHRALLPTLENYGDAAFDVDPESGDVLRFSWSVSAEQADFEDWSHAWLGLAMRHGRAADFAPGVRAVTAAFCVAEGTAMTEPGSSVSATATVPDGQLALRFTLPWDAVGKDFLAYDRALVRTLGKFADDRYRLVTAGEEPKKLTWRRKR